MKHFAQHTALVAAEGRAGALAAKFMESVDMQRDNPDCELMIVSTSPTDADVVYLTEVWSSEAAWDAARHSPAIEKWARDMPSLVAAPPQSIRFDPVGGKGLR